MNALDTILQPIEWVVANIMVLVHQGLELLGMDPASGLTWGLSIVGLTAVIRMTLIPVFVRQIKAQRSMQVIAPDLRKIQDKYKGKKDQASREAMTKETMALYSEHKTNPFASCLPLLLQMPIFFSLFRVLNYRLKENGESIGLLSDTLREQARAATLFGAKLSDTFLGAEASATRWIAAVLIVTMVATTFFSQRQLTFKNMPASALEGPMAQQQKILLYALPFIFVLSGPNFPIGVLIYWTVSNAWSMGQQFYVIRRNPTPGSEAEKALIARRTEKAARKGLTIDGRTLEEARIEEEAAAAAAEEERRSRQRQQPKRNKRKKGAAKPGKADEPRTPGDASEGNPTPGIEST
ncbi:MAG: membrane protein insertase YidC [Actinobacteria bacterium HGW-Actinobacteria-8]|nr:MAG: membrane protein insertase YidC [Actinobacteria bacterium HGW-Actinobacteria-8]